MILVWKVEDTFKAAFDVDDYASFVRVQTDAAVRKLAGSYSYDNFDDEQAEITLRSGFDEVNHELERELDANKFWRIHRSATSRCRSGLWRQASR